MNTRRSFLRQAAGSAALLSSWPRGAGGFSSAPCRWKSKSPFPASLEKFIARVPAGTDEFLCEKYAQELESALAPFSGAPHDVATLSRLTTVDVKFSGFDAEILPLRQTGPIKTARVKFGERTAQGRSGFLASWRRYLSGFSKIEHNEFQIAALRVVKQSALTLETSIYYKLSGTLANADREQRTGQWTLQWSRLESGPWQIEEWHALEETRATLSGPGFAEITAHAFEPASSYREQMRHGVDTWRSTLDGACGLDVYGNNGVAVGDIDNDGFDDIYVCQPSGLPNRLYRNRGDGTFEDVTDRSGLGLLDGTASALFADFTNSGTQDLLVVRTNGPLLFLNQGGGRFELKPDAFRFAKAPEGTFTGVAAADYNRDGRLDVYFCLYAYYQGLSQYTHPKPYYDAQNGPPNFLMRNRGDGTFEDVTESSGMNQNNNRFSFACGWCDYDGNGWPDLYVANDFGRKNFYRSKGDGTFTDVAELSGVEDYGAGMSVSWADFDGDGRPDLYVTDMWSAAGQRVTEQDTFLPGVEETIRRAYRQHASGNGLYRNQGGGRQLEDISGKAGVRMGRWSWSADAWDIAHAGCQDLYVANGFISGPDRGDLASFFWRQIVARSLDTGSGSTDYELAWNAINELIRADRSWDGYERNVVFLNNNDGTFAEASGVAGLDFEDDSRAFSLFDFDHDGRLEVLLKNRNAPQLRLLRNELKGIGNSIVFRLEGTKSNRDAIGAAITLEAGTHRQTKFLAAGSGFLSQHSKEMHFGTGASMDAVRATVRWPSGLVESFDNLPVNHRISLREGDAAVRSEPFLTKRAFPSQAAGAGQNSLPTSFGTWLLEPLRLPPFSLPDASGKIHTLEEFRGRPLLLMLVSSGCERSRAQLAAFTKRPSLPLLGIRLDGGPSTLSEVDFPMLAADESTASIFNILYRYLYDRRRDLETPVSLLIDPRGFAIKIYTGGITPAEVVEDWSGAPRNATEQLRKALPFSGHYHGALPTRNYFTYGIAFIQNQQVDAALACFEEAVARNPNYAAAYYNLGTIYLNKQQPEKAKANLEKAVSLDPQDADAWTNLGAVAGQQKDYDGALRNFQQALRVKPAHLMALQNLVMLYRWQNRLDLAQQAVETAIAADPNDPEFHFALGMLLASQNKFETARQELERTLQLRPSDSTALNNLGVVYLRLNKPDAAMVDFERCTQLAPDYDRPYLNIALIQSQAGDAAKARQTLQSFLVRHPDNKELKQALEQLGR